jgi:hypothetical protein
MTVEGTTVVRMIASTREEQLEREVNDLHAQLELKQAQLEQANTRVAAGGPSEPENKDMVALGGGFIAEADGWLWLVWRGQLTRLQPASAEDVESAEAVRGRIRHAHAEQERARMRYAS